MGVNVRWNSKAGQFYLYECYDKQRKAYATGLTLETAANAKKAEGLAKLRREMHAKDDLGIKAPIASPTLAVYLPEWVETLSARCKTTTIDGYRREIKNHIVPVIGHLLVKDVTKKDIRGLILHWQKTGLRTATLRLVLSAIRNAMTAAVPDYRPDNPAFKLNAECKQPDQVPKEIEFFTPAESTQLLASTLPQGQAVHALFLILLRAGVRIGECLALEWRAVNFVERRIDIYQSRNQEGIVTSVKQKRRRSVDLNLGLAGYLQGLPKPKNPKDLICQHPDGRAYEYWEVQRLVARTMESADVRCISIHGMRHTFVSQLLANRVPIHYVSRQIGHRSIQLTVDTYGHLVPGANLEWIDSLTPLSGSPA